MTFSAALDGAICAARQGVTAWVVRQKGGPLFYAVTFDPSRGPLHSRVVARVNRDQAPR